MKTFLKKTITIALSMALCLTGLVPALSAHAENTVGKTLVIKKVLTKAEKGVTTPNETFDFTATAHSFNDDAGQASKCPALKTGNAAYTSADNTDGDASAEGKQLIKISSDMLDGISFNQVGQYTYTIKERAGSTNGMKYSGAEYLVSMFVVKNASNKYVVDSIQIKQTKNDEGASVTSGGKIAYAPDPDGNKLLFNNVYNKKSGNTNPTGNNPTNEDKEGFVIDKVVATATDAEFKFSLTLTAPAGASSSATSSLPTGKIVGADGNVKSTVTMSAYGTSTQFILKKGERLVIANVLMGSTAKVAETDAQGFTPSVKANGVGGTVTNVSVLENDGVVLGDGGNNYATVTNAQQSATGVIIDNLPFIIVLIIAAMGIGMYIRNRKKAWSEN